MAQEIHFLQPHEAITGIGRLNRTAIISCSPILRADVKLAVGEAHDLGDAIVICDSEGMSTANIREYHQGLFHVERYTGAQTAYKENVEQPPATCSEVKTDPPYELIFLAPGQTFGPADLTWGFSCEFKEKKYLSQTSLQLGFYGEQNNKYAFCLTAEEAKDGFEKYEQGLLTYKEIPVVTNSKHVEIVYKDPSMQKFRDNLEALENLDYLAMDAALVDEEGERYDEIVKQMVSEVQEAVIDYDKLVGAFDRHIDGMGGGSEMGPGVLSWISYGLVIMLGCGLLWIVFGKATCRWCGAVVEDKRIGHGDEKRESDDDHEERKKLVDGQRKWDKMIDEMRERQRKVRGISPHPHRGRSIQIVEKEKEEDEEEKKKMCDENKRIYDREMERLRRSRDLRLAREAAARKGGSTQNVERETDNQDNAADGTNSAREGFASSFSKDIPSFSAYVHGAETHGWAAFKDPAERQEVQRMFRQATLPILNRNDKMSMKALWGLKSETASLQELHNLKHIIVVEIRKRERERTETFWDNDTHSLEKAYEETLEKGYIAEDARKGKATAPKAVQTDMPVISERAETGTKRSMLVGATITALASKDKTATELPTSEKPWIASPVADLPHLEEEATATPATRDTATAPLETTPPDSASGLTAARFKRSIEERMEAAGKRGEFPSALSTRERTLGENHERAYVAASRRSDRSIAARMESAHRASEIYEKRTGRRLKVSKEDVHRTPFQGNEEEGIISYTADATFVDKSAPKWCTEMINKTPRTDVENKELSCIAASHESGRPICARMDYARRASTVHKERPGHALKITQSAFINKEIYCEDVGADSSAKASTTSLPDLRPGGEVIPSIATTTFVDKLTPKWYMDVVNEVVPRTDMETQELKFIAGSHQPHLSIAQRMEFARQASVTHKKRCWRGLKIPQSAVLNEEIYEEGEMDDQAAKASASVADFPPLDARYNEQVIGLAIAHFKTYADGMKAIGDAELRKRDARDLENETADTKMAYFVLDHFGGWVGASCALKAAEKEMKKTLLSFEDR